MRKYLLILLIFSVFLSEIALSINEIAGFLLYSVLIASVFIAFSRAEEIDNYGKIAVFMLIVPMLRVAEIFIPLSLFWRTVIFYYLLFFLVIFYSFKFRINLSFRRKNLLLLPLVIILAIGLGILGNKLFSLQKTIELLYILPIIAFSEEVLFRGLIQNIIKKEYGWLIAILIPAILYSIFSLSFGIYFGLFIFFVSLIIGLIYNFCRNIFLTIIINMILQIFLFVIPEISL